MNILEIIDNRRDCTVAFCEWPSGVPALEVVRHWVAMQGLTEEARRQFRCNGGPIIPWRSIKDAFMPCSELTPTR
jgi:hypothetical protein